MMRHNHKRGVDRKPFEHAIAFEAGTMEAGVPSNIRKDGQCVDISSKGMGLTTDHLLYKGEILMVDLPVDSIDVTLPVYSEVMWTKADKGFYRAGLRFLV